MGAFRDAVEFGVRQDGPLVAELIECSKCHRVELVVHPFRETVPCDCGHTNASNVPIYDFDDLNG